MDRNVLPPNKGRDAMARLDPVSGGAWLTTAGAAEFVFGFVAIRRRGFMTVIGRVADDGLNHDAWGVVALRIVFDGLSDQ